MGGKVVLMKFEGYIRVEDDKGREMTRKTFSGHKACRSLLTRYTETFKIALEEERVFIVVVHEID
jgi:hypothetical protein